MAEINPYDPSLPIEIYSDASYSGGCGFIAGQRIPGGALMLFK